MRLSRSERRRSGSGCGTGRRWPTVLALEGPVGGDACETSEAMRLGELLGDLLAGARVHLVRGLTVEGGVGDHGVVLGDVEGDEPLDGGEGVELVQEEPVVLQGAPPGLDHGVGEGDVDLGDDPAEQAFGGGQGGIDGGVDVLDAGVGDDGGLGVRREVQRGLEEDGAGGLGIEAGDYLPGEDAAAEVVDGGMEVDLGPVEEADDGDVEVPVLVGLGGAKALRGPGRMDAQSWANPAVLADGAEPGGRGGEEDTEALSEDGQGPDRDVSVVWTGDQVFMARSSAGESRVGLSLGQLVRSSSWQARPSLRQA